MDVNIRDVDQERNDQDSANAADADQHTNQEAKPGRKRKEQQWRTDDVQLYFRGVFRSVQAELAKGRSDGKRRPAATGCGCIRIIHAESSAHQVIEIVNRGAHQVLNAE